MSAEIIPFNPLDKKNLGASVAEAMLLRAAEPLGAVKAFKGAGIYAIYYSGSNKAYAALTKMNTGPGGPMIPIYVGKAIPEGGRKGVSLRQTSTTTVLSKRLKEHADSIAATATLDLDHFTCRYLVVDDIWIPLGESLLIAKFSPVWNVLVDGFGNHDPGGGRYNGLRPRWDVLHPGRRWAEKCKERAETDAQIAADVMQYFRATPMPASPHILPGE